MPRAAPVTIATLSLSRMLPSGLRLRLPQGNCRPRANVDHIPEPVIMGPAFAETTSERSTPSEQAIEKPAIERAIDHLRAHGFEAPLANLCFVRRWWQDGARHCRGERGGAGEPRQGCDRDALVGDPHEA